VSATAVWTESARLGQNFFTKRHATSVICRLTVQTLSDGFETQFTPPAWHDTDSTVLSCLADGVNQALVKQCVLLSTDVVRNRNALCWLSPSSASKDIWEQSIRASTRTGFSNCKNPETACSREGNRKPKAVANDGINRSRNRRTESRKQRHYALPPANTWPATNRYIGLDFSAVHCNWVFPASLSFFTSIYTVSQKKRYQILAHNFTKY